MRLLLILAPALLLVSCAHVGVTTLRAANPKVATCSLDVYSSPEEIKKPYEVLCLLDARTGTTAFAERSGAGAINEARPYACRCGGDAILIESVRNEGMTLVTNGQGFATVKVLKYTNQEGHQ